MNNETFREQFIKQLDDSDLKYEVNTPFVNYQYTSLSKHDELISNKMHIETFTISGKNHTKKTLEIAKSIDLTNNPTDVNTFIYFYEASAFQCNIVIVTNTGIIPAWLTSINRDTEKTTTQIIDETSKRDYLKEIVDNLSPQIVDLTSNHNAKAIVEDTLRKLTNSHYEDSQQFNDTGDNLNLTNVRYTSSLSDNSYSNQFAKCFTSHFDLTTSNTKASALEDLPEPIKQYISNFL